MNTLRKVDIYEWKIPKGKTAREKVKTGEGLFHQFGLDYEEFDNGAGNFSTAIIEMPNGEIKNVPVENIIFK